MSYELYKEYVAENPECYEDSLKLEKEMRELKVKWESTEEKQSLNMIFENGFNNNTEENSELFDEKLDTWEKEYMTMVRL